MSNGTWNFPTRLVHPDIPANGRVLKYILDDGVNPIEPFYMASDGIPKSMIGADGAQGPAGDVVDRDLIDSSDGSSSFYFTSVASDFGGGRLNMTKDIPGAGGFSITKLGAVDTDLVVNFASLAGIPDTTYLPSGPITISLSARQTGGTQVSRLYAEFYHRTTLGVSTLIATSDFSEILTGSNSIVKAFAKIEPYRNMLATDRLEVVIRANVTGAGTAPDIVIDIQGATSSRCKFPFEPISQSLVDSKQDLISDVNNGFLYQVSPGNIATAPGITRDTDTGGFNTNLEMLINNTGSKTMNYWKSDIETSVASVNDNVVLHGSYIEFDQNDSGFDLGTSGSAAGFFNSQFQHNGLSDIGDIYFISNYFDIGNSADPIDCKGFSYNYGFGDIRANVNISGAMQGYGYQPTIDASATADPVNSYTNAFYDNAKFNCASGGYTSANFSPNIAEIVNNRNYQGVNINANIPLFTGNAGYTGIGLYGSLGTFGASGYYQGININPTITSVPSATGIQVNMSNVTGANVKAMDIVGDVFINGALSFTGALSMGQLSAFYASNPIDGGGNPQNMHGLTTSMTALNGVTTANVDAIGTNNAMLIEMEANSISTSGGFKLGFAAVALPCVVRTETGSTLDYMNMAVYALNLDGTSTGGTIDRVNGVRVEAIPNGVTTINEFVAFEFNQTFGQVGTDVWGFNVEASFAENHLAGSLNIGNATRKVTNSSVAIEIGSTTKAFVNARMTTVQKMALTAIDGMQVYDTTLNKLQVYSSALWVNLH